MMVTRHALDTQNQIQSNIAGITWTQQDKVLNKLQIFPSCAPEEGTAELQEYQDKIPSIEGGEGRSLGMQAAYQGCQIALFL